MKKSFFGLLQPLRQTQVIPPQFWHSRFSSAYWMSHCKSCPPVLFLHWFCQRIPSPSQRSSTTGVKRAKPGSQLQFEKQRKPEAKNHNSCSNIQMQAMPQSSLLRSTSKKSSLFTFSTKAKKSITRSERRMRGLQVPEVSRQGRTASTKRPDSPPPPREQVTITR